MSQDSNSNSAPGAVLNEQQWNAITQAIAGLNRDQLTWVSGYAAGMAAAQGGDGRSKENERKVDSKTETRKETRQ